MPDILDQRQINLHDSPNKLFVKATQQVVCKGDPTSCL